jgi:hypothetical protein
VRPPGGLKPAAAAGLALAWLAAPLPAAAADLCEGAREAAVDVRTEIADTALDLTARAATLADMTELAAHPQGLYRGELDARLRMSFGGLARAEERCVWLAEAVVEVTLSPRIYIARELPEGSCLFDAVMEHERQHARIDREELAGGEERLEDAIAEAARRAGPVLAVGRAAEQMSEEIATAVEAAFRRALAEVERHRQVRQQAIDTPAEYARIGARCS